MLRRVFVTFLVTLILSSFGVVTLEAGRGGHYRRGNSHHHRVITLDQILDALDLTEAQRAEVDGTVDGLTLAAAPKEEVRTAIVAHLEAFDVEVPVVLRSKLEQQLTTLDLTDAQRAEVDALFEANQAAGTSAEATRDAVVTLLRDQGVEIPTYLLGHVDRLLVNLELTEEQIIAIKESVDALQAADATKTEIRSAIHAQLEDMGIEVTQNTPIKRGHRGGFHYFLFDLTEDQRVEILAVVTQMQVAGAAQDEVHAAIRDLLVEWDIIEGNADDGEADAAADLAIIDGQIQGAPSAIPIINRKLTSWGAIKSDR